MLAMERSATMMIIDFFCTAVLLIRHGSSDLGLLYVGDNSVNISFQYFERLLDRWHRPEEDIAFHR
jgi:hypothetical protein